MESYYDAWQGLFADSETQQANSDKISLYYGLETEAYKMILADKLNVIEGSYKEVQDRLGFAGEPVVFLGFLEGLQDSLEEKLDLADLNDESDLKLVIDFKKLYLAMRNAKAKWLYELEEWDQAATKSDLNAWYQEWRQGHIRHVEKVGRNEPCPCGSGKKYKKCCGR